MDGSKILDIGLGLAIIFAVFAMVASGISDLIAGWFNLRGKMLYDALGHVLGEAARDVVLNHGLVQAQNKDGGSAPTTRVNSPSYLPSWMFTLATLQRDLTAPGPAAPTPADLVESAVAQLPTSGAGGAIASLARQYGDDMTKIVSGIETWFDAYMDRVQGWYKRKSQWVLFFVSLFVAITANVNVIGITHALANDDALRSQLANTAVASCDGKTGGEKEACVNEAVKALPSTKLGLLWQPTCALDSCPGNFLEQRGLSGPGDWLTWAIGVAMGAIAISLGAPFWFDLIGKGKALKSAGGEPEHPAPTPPTVGPQPSSSTPLANAIPGAVTLSPAGGTPPGPVLATPNERQTGRKLAADAPAAAATQTALPDFP